MNKMFRYPGAKTDEMDDIIPHLPSFTTLVEPFAGAASLSFHLECPQTHLNELDPRIYNFYQVCQDPQSYASLLRYAKHWEGQWGTGVEAEYFSRQALLDTGTPLERAKSWLMYRWGAISGIYRKSRLQCRRGTFSSTLGAEHHHFLKGVNLTNGTYESCLQAHDNPGTFLFVDPPYLDTKDYPVNHGRGRDDWRHDVSVHETLRDRLAGMVNAKWMLIHLDVPCYHSLYKGYTIRRYIKRYRMGHKDVWHLCITNY